MHLTHHLLHLYKFIICIIHIICTIFTNTKLTAAHKALRAQERSEGGVRIQFSASSLEEFFKI